MASEKQIVNMIAAIKSIYPYYSKDGDARTVFSLWMALFSDVPDEVIQPAFKLCLQSCRVPPTPADVFDNINKVREMALPSVSELWDVLDKALRKTESIKYEISYTSNFDKRRELHDELQRVWDTLPAPVRDYVGSKGELTRLADSTDTDIKFLKQNFMRDVKVSEDTRLELTASQYRLLEK